MERRKAIKSIMTIAGAAWFVPGVLANEINVSRLHKELSIGRDDANLLAEVVDTIIPQTDTPGAKSLKVDLFVLTMVQDCYTEKLQAAFTAGLKELNTYSLNTAGLPFLKLGPAKRLQLLKSIAAGNSSEDLNGFLRSARELTILGYSTSEYIMTNVLPYKLVPGYFKGCVPLTARVK